MERPACQYGSACYRKNPQHHIDFSHPPNILQTISPEILKDPQLDSSTTLVSSTVVLKDLDEGKDLPPLVPLLRQLSVSAKHGLVGSEEKAHIKDLLLSGDKTLVLSAVTILGTLATPPTTSEASLITPQNEPEGKQGSVMYLLRGISGSGKSTLSVKLTTQGSTRVGMVCSTDDYFVNASTGMYQFDNTRLQEAHSWNQQRVKSALRDGITPIVVDNTNTQCWEAKPYVLMAVKYGYEVRVEEPTTWWAKDAKELAKRNQHGVPLEAIQRMLDRWEEDFTVQSILASRPPARRKPQVSEDRNRKKSDKPATSGQDVTAGWQQVQKR